jgi:hypothetical protein
MRKALIALAAALTLSAPAFAQEVSVGSTSKGSTFANVSNVWSLENKVEVIGEVRLSSKNANTVKVGVQRNFVEVGPVSLGGRLNFVQGFGKTSWSGYSVEPTASFKYDKAAVTVGYEIGDSFSSRHKQDVETAKVTVMYPFTFGNFGLQYENERGDLKQESVSLVYSLKH